MEPAHDTAAAAPPALEGDPKSLERYLLSFDWPGRDAAVEEMIVTGGLPVWREILRLLPDATPERDRLLELGSLPFHTTLLVQKLRRYRITTTAGVADERRRLTQHLESRDFGERYTFDCACFDLEHERFPFADGAFDAVLFCEVIEHLFENPVFTLSEIHRVLKPGGALILSTPNAARSGNLLRIFFGGNPFDQYHLGSPLRGSRHSREFTLHELESLIGGCGFRIDRAVGRNLGQTQYTRRTRIFEPLFRAFTWIAPGEHADHLFVRALKNGPFRWHFPREIFDEGHLHSYLDVRTDDVVAGDNDVPHTTGFWGPLQVRGGMAARAIGRAGGSVHLLATAAAQSIALELAPGPRSTHVTATANAGDVAIGTAALDLRAEEPASLAIRLQRPVAAGERLRVDLEASDGEALVHRVRLDPAA